MDEIEWGDPSTTQPGNEKYPAMLASIKRSSLEDDHREWGILIRMPNEASARDLASRLGRVHDEFEVVSRKHSDSTIVYARLKEGVTV